MKRKGRIYISFFKPLMDFVISFLLILMLLPIYLITYFIILCTSKGNPIFKQKRIGRNNKPFNMYKFRTLKCDAPHNVQTEMIGDINEYYCRCGKFFRMTHIDELPQLFNILFFQMSFVGPRPHIEIHEKLIKTRTESGVNKLRPGMTGLAQISARSHPFNDEEKALHDAKYLENVSFLYDIKIFFKTISFIFDMIIAAYKRKKRI